MSIAGGKALKVSLNLPSPQNWRWTDPHNWMPLWTILPEAGTSSRAYCAVAVRKGCKRQCKKAVLKCTTLCLGSGECNED